MPDKNEQRERTTRGDLVQKRKPPDIVTGRKAIYRAKSSKYVEGQPAGLSHSGRLYGLQGDS